MAVLRLLFGGDIDWTGENTLDPITIKHTCKSVRTSILRSPSAISIIIKPTRIMEIALGDLWMKVLTDLQVHFIVMGSRVFAEFKLKSTKDGVNQLIEYSRPMVYPL